MHSWAPTQKRIDDFEILRAVAILFVPVEHVPVIPNGWSKQVHLWFGPRSYAIYLIHIPAYSFTREIWYRLQPVGTIYTDGFAVRFANTAVILLLVLAELNYRLVEVPFRRRGIPISRIMLGRFETDDDTFATEGGNGIVQLGHLKGNTL
jgi:peptidoglycan/LPS O-acetylase OafA/YrhL